MTFTVTVSPSQHSFEVDENEYLLDAALRQGVNLPYGCRNGACGACKGKVLSGETTFLPGAPTMALTDLDRSEGVTLFCQAIPTSDITIQGDEVHEAAEIRPRLLTTKVAGLDRLSHDVMRLRLKLPESERMQFLAGQYIDILLDDGGRRAFSLANPPHDDQFLELHIRLVRGGRFTEYVFNQMQEKEILRIEGPYGNFYFREESERPVILVAGGTGFAPIKGVLEHAFAEGVSRPLHLYWGVRSETDLYHNELVEEWLTRYPNLSYTPVLSEPEKAGWQGRSGYVHEAVASDYPDLSGHEIYMCGPPPMIEAGRQAFKARGLTDSQLYFDSFEFAAQK